MLEVFRELVKLCSKSCLVNLYGTVGCTMTDLCRKLVCAHEFEQPKSAWTTWLHSSQVRVVAAVCLGLKKTRQGASHLDMAFCIRQNDRTQYVFSTCVASKKLMKQCVSLSRDRYSTSMRVLFELIETSQPPIGHYDSQCVMTVESIVFV